MIDLNEHYSSVAERFLQTAIVIDDQAQLGPVVLAAPVQSVVAPPRGLLDAAASGAVVQPVSVAVETTTDASSATLDAKTLSEAFLARKMICGLYKPSPGEEMVGKTIGAAQSADIVVVDWHLVQGSSRQAKDIVLGLLAADRLEKGRLRLIAIYTSQPGREAIAGELLAEVEEHDNLKGLLRQDGATLLSADTRITVFNKTRTPDAADRREVSEEALPGLLVEEFAHLTRGVLPSFALSAVAAVRRGAHHVLALHTSEMDGAFIAHRCEIPHPDDSKGFAVDLITSELRNLIELDNVPEATLGAPIIEAWIEARAQEGHRFKTNHAELPSNEVKKLVSGGADALKKSKEVQHVPGDQSTRATQGIKQGTLARVFYSDAAGAKRSVRRLACFSTFQRETSRTRLPEGWRPKLTLGSLIRRVAEGGAGEMLLCVQPRCDSIRLAGRTSFPFQTVTLEGSAFNLVVPDLNGEEIEAWVNLKPRDARMIDFDPDQERQAVLASRETPKGPLLFRDIAGQTYAWIGDLKAMKAQGWAGELGSRVQAVGMEELELLRLAGTRGITREWAG